MPGEDERHLLAAIELARRARENGNHPFGALLVDDAGDVVLEAENTVVTARDPTGHAELNLIRRAGERFDPDFLQRCTMYASTEPWGRFGASPGAIPRAPISIFRAARSSRAQTTRST